jgi:putative lipoic acid-binding regulatory protein
LYRRKIGMEKDNKSIEFYKRLKIQLEENTSWPAVYLYKFIVPANKNNVEKIEQIFIDNKANFSKRDSSKGTYSSVSIKVLMESPDCVIEKYIEVSKIEGVISL